MGEGAGGTFYQSFDVTMTPSPTLCIAPDDDTVTTPSSLVSLNPYEHDRSNVRAMKKSKKKLVLNRETLRNLSDNDQEAANGGRARISIELSLCYTACDGTACYTLACTSFTGC